MKKEKLLLICPTFFNYYRPISEALEGMGFEVHMVPDRPPGGTLWKILIRKMRWLVEPKLQQFHAEQLRRIGPVSRVIIIRGESVTPKTVSVLREACNGPIILYHWDSLVNVPGAEKLLPLVDRVITFDPFDARERGFDLLPMFYINSSLKQLVDNGSDKSVKAAKPDHWDLCFLGSIHSDRPRIVSAIKRQVGKMFVFMYFPSRLIYWFRCLTDPNIWSLSSEEISFKPMERDGVDQIFFNSRAILDVHHPKQMGLTPRAIEGLVLGKKLITTNQTIKEYPFYDSKQILVIDRKAPVVPQDFVKSTVEITVHPELKKLEVKTWIRGLL